MSKKKKRNKPYRGPGARANQPSIVRLKAVKRSRPHQWYVDNQTKIKPFLKIALVVIIVIICIIGIVELVTSR